MNFTKPDTIYDSVPYPSLSYKATHPDRLATVATVLGMSPPSVGRCRVLELGCASGGNLMAMAANLPDGEFVGLDLSTEQVAQGQTVLDAVGLPNVRLEQMDIQDILEQRQSTPCLTEPFDYIIAHGIFSWVAPTVQDTLLDVCQALLTDNGIAYVSYNAYPGWHMLGAVREMMRYHVRDETDPQARAAKARQLLNFLADSDSIEEDVQSGFLKAYVTFIKEHSIPKDDAFLIHDELSDINHPIYFQTFARRAAMHGLQYLGEADFHTMLATNLPPAVAEKLREMATDVISAEQYLDFLRNRTFRRTLLCHQKVDLPRAIRPGVVNDLYVGAAAVPLTRDGDIAAQTVERFKGYGGATFATDHPGTKAALHFLSQVWPQCIPFHDLVRECRQRLRGGWVESAEEVGVLQVNLLRAYGYSENLVELHVHMPQFALQVSPCPTAGPLTRFQARSDEQLTNLRHERVDLDEAGRFLLARLDGSHSLADLVQLLAEALREGEVHIETETDTAPASADSPSADLDVTSAVKTRLAQFAHSALLTG